MRRYFTFEQLYSIYSLFLEFCGQCQNFILDLVVGILSIVAHADQSLNIQYCSCINIYFIWQYSTSG